MSSGTDANISHVIPSVHLKGSRADKLRKLDTLIAYVEQLRTALAGNATIPPGHDKDRPRYLEQTAVRWFTAGTLCGALLAALLVAARSCSL